MATQDDILARRQRLYRKQIEGLPARQLVIAIALKENVT